jgi:hypothetical protein
MCGLNIARAWIKAFVDRKFKTNLFDFEQSPVNGNNRKINAIIFKHLQVI